MGTFEQLIAAIKQRIKQNGTNAITGEILQNALTSIVNTIGQYATFAGVADPTTGPGTPDQNVFFIAATEGTYDNFDAIDIEKGEIAILYNSTGSWQKTTITITFDGENVVEYFNKDTGMIGDPDNPRIILMSEDLFYRDGDTESGDPNNQSVKTNITNIKTNITDIKQAIKLAFRQRTIELWGFDSVNQYYYFGLKNDGQWIEGEKVNVGDTFMVEQEGEYVLVPALDAVASLVEGDIIRCTQAGEVGADGYTVNPRFELIRINI